MFAANNGHDNIVKMLIDGGAEVDMKNIVRLCCCGCCGC